MLSPIKHWSLNRTIPTMDDSESVSVLELVGKVTTKINELINEYNGFVELINKTIEEFTTDITKDQEEFKESIEKIVHDYIKMLDEKIKLQDSEINEAILYMKDNLAQSITNTVSLMAQNGELDEAIVNSIDNIGSRVTTLENTEYRLVYEEGTENLILQKTIKEGE